MLYLFIAQPMIFKKHLALGFMIFFMVIISAPTIILSIDNSIDTSVLLGLNEEEEKEDIKVLFEVGFECMDDLSSEGSNSGHIVYTSKSYLKPHINLIFPPPEKHIA